jgi:hypothetical protein
LPGLSCSQLLWLRFHSDPAVRPRGQGREAVFAVDRMVGRRDLREEKVFAVDRVGHATGWAQWNAILI